MTSPYYDGNVAPVVAAASVVNLRAVLSNLFEDANTARILGLGTFEWDSVSTAVDDGSTVIKPDDITHPDPGRWLVIPAGGASGSGTDNHLVRWNGTSDIQDSGLVVTDGQDLSGLGDTTFNPTEVTTDVRGGYPLTDDLAGRNVRIAGGDASTQLGSTERDGGRLTLLGGSGPFGGAIPNKIGDGGYIEIEGGYGGFNTDSGDAGDGGGVYLYGGDKGLAGTGADGAYGVIEIGVWQTSAVEIGDDGIPTTIWGEVYFRDLTGTASFLDLTEGQSAPVSVANHGRIRYNVTANRFEISENGGAWTPLAGLSGSGTDNHLMRWNGTSAAQNSDWVLDDSDAMEIPSGALIRGVKSTTGTANLLEWFINDNFQIGSNDTGNAYWNAGGGIFIRPGGLQRFNFQTSGFTAALPIFINHAANQGYLDATDGQSAPVSAASHGRLRYNENAGAQRWEYSADGGAWAPLVGLSGSGTDNKIARWDGTGALQDSGVTISDGASLTFDSSGTGAAKSIGTGAAAAGGPSDDLSLYSADGGNSATGAGGHAGWTELRGGGGGNSTSGSHNGGNAGDVYIWAYDAGEATGAGNTGGAGGEVWCGGSAGGRGYSNANGGAGGWAGCQAGDGGWTDETGTGTAGAGGRAYLTGGRAGRGKPQVGGDVRITGGQGAVVTLSAGGKGGPVLIAGGAGGTSPTQSDGGDVSIDGGASVGSGTDGVVTVGTANTSAVTIGATGVLTTINGTVSDVVFANGFDAITVGTTSPATGGSINLSNDNGWIRCGRAGTDVWMLGQSGGVVYVGDQVNSIQCDVRSSQDVFVKIGTTSELWVKSGSTSLNDNSALRFGWTDIAASGDVRFAKGGHSAYARNSANNDAVVWLFDTSNDLYWGDAAYVANCIYDALTSHSIDVGGTPRIKADTTGLGFFNVTPVAKPTALTTALTTITHTGPTTPDYAIATPVDSGVGSAWGFSTQDEFETAMSVTRNLQIRVNELETKLRSLGLLT